MTTEDLFRSSELASLGVSRAGSQADAIDGVVPRLVIEPATAQQVADTLSWASRERLRTVIRGGGTKQGWGPRPAAVDLVISLARLNRLVAHRHGDLTATFEAGATLLAMEAALARERQWLPIDSAFADATIGGIVATNDAGPLRHRHGTPRDLLIGVTLALTDGRLVKSGGHVVKNVAGYDLGKLVSGSYGALAAVVDATFKLAPIPAASRTIVARYDDAETLARDVVTLAAGQVEPTAFEVNVSLGSTPGFTLYLRIATSPAAVDVQAATVGSMVAVPVRTVSGDEERALWESHVRRPWDERGVLIRMSWLPASLSAVIAVLTELQGAAAIELTARAAVGTGLLRVDAGDDAALVAIERLRARRDVVGNVVVLRASAALKSRLDVWGARNEMGSVVASLKRTFDPAGILNAGRGPL